MEQAGVQQTQELRVLLASLQGTLNASSDRWGRARGRAWWRRIRQSGPQFEDQAAPIRAVLNHKKIDNNGGPKLATE